VLPARKRRDRSRDDESLLIRSAESLGRMIGSLQRQLDGAGRRLAETANDVVENLPDIPLGGGTDVSRRSGAKRKRTITTGTKQAATRKRTARKSAARSRKTRSVRPSRKGTATRSSRER
jgi:hypothetical protein